MGKTSFQHFDPVQLNWATPLVLNLNFPEQERVVFWKGKGYIYLDVARQGVELKHPLAC